MEKFRIDKYLYAVRIFKTSSLAAHACEMEKIKIGGQLVKASRNVNTGDIITVKSGPFERTLKVIQLFHKRQGEKQGSDYCIDITPAEGTDKIKTPPAPRSAWRQPGIGRPTTKDRRNTISTFQQSTTTATQIQ